MKEIREFHAQYLTRIVVFFVLFLVLVSPPALVFPVMLLSGLEGDFVVLLTFFISALAWIIVAPVLIALMILFVKLCTMKIVIKRESIGEHECARHFDIHWNDVEQFAHETVVLTYPSAGRIYLQIFEVRSHHNHVRFSRRVDTPPEEEMHWIKNIPLLSPRTWKLDRFGVPLDRMQSAELLAILEGQLGRESDFYHFI